VDDDLISLIAGLPDTHPDGIVQTFLNDEFNVN
jgi:hypothetical protein